MERFFHVTVIGGGPAGLCAAIVLRRAGLDVALIEKRKWPIDKACGEGIMPSGLARLRELGLLEKIGTAGYPIKGISYSAGTARATADFLEGPGLGLRRTILSSALSDIADNLGVVFYNQDARPEFPFNGQLQVGKDQITTRLLIAADGLHSRIRKLAGLQISRRSHHRWGIRQHFETSSPSDYVQVVLGDHCEAYITPTAPKEAGQAILWNSKKISPVGGHDAYPSLYEYLPDSLLQGTATSAPLAVGPLEQRTSSVIADGCLLVGDAAGYIDAITGEGISLAVEEAFALRLLVPELKAGRTLLTKKQLLPYQEQYRRITFNYKLSTRALLFLSAHFWLAQWMVLFLSRRPALFQALLSFNMGTLGARDLGRALLGKSIRGKRKESQEIT